MAHSSLISTLKSYPQYLMDKVVGLAENVWEDHRVELFTVVSLVVGAKAYTTYRSNQRRKKWKNAGKNVIVLHSFPRGKAFPNLSPFIIKLETYFRMTGLKYEIDIEEPFGPKTKTPWITINGQDLGDSELIMEFLDKKFNLNLNKNLTTEQLGAARAFAIMADEHMFWAIALWRVIQDPNQKLLSLMRDPPFYLKFMVTLGLGKILFRSRAKAQGVGHHSDKEIIAIMLEDCKAISLYLGDKKYLMGDEPCEADCSVFGSLCQFVWGTPGSPYEAAIKNEFPNLLQYSVRMKEKFYPDWDKL